MKEGIQLDLFKQIIPPKKLNPNRCLQFGEDCPKDCLCHNCMKMNECDHCAIICKIDRRM